MKELKEKLEEDLAATKAAHLGGFYIPIETAEAILSSMEDGWVKIEELTKYIDEISLANSRTDQYGDGFEAAIKAVRIALASLIPTP